VRLFCSTRRARASKQASWNKRRGDPVPFFLPLRTPWTDDQQMIFSFQLLFEAIVFGILLGCFYAAVSIGLSILNTYYTIYRFKKVNVNYIDIEPSNLRSAR